MPTKLIDDVREILEKHPSTRGNDNLLYYYYFKKHFSTTDLNDIKELKVNRFASVSRFRQKIQNEMPWLRPNEVTQTYRKKREERFREELRNQL